MRNELLKCMHKNQLAELIYISHDGTITKRRVKVYKVYEQYFQGYCFLRRATRTFNYNNILALVPVIEKERMVV
mgnify:CR=1 FL=1